MSKVQVEWKVVGLSTETNPEIAAKLNALSAEGWTLHSVSEGDHWVRLYLRRWVHQA